MKEPGLFGDSLPGEGVELTLRELEDMACRQQHQIDSQRQLLAAKEQRLRFLKQHEARHQQVAAEHERLRRLRDRVEAQELKLRKLRALRGQVDQNKLNNASLTSDLDSIRALFNEKEKELCVAVAKVEELTRQLEELRRGRGNREQLPPPQAAHELDKLKRELMFRNKLNEQQNARLSQQREALCQRQEEMSNIDKRISELQDRLHRKRLLNQQLANQITAASNKANSQHHLRNALSASTIQQHQQQYPGVSGAKPVIRALTAGNIAAIEPYHHVPNAKTLSSEQEEHPRLYSKRADTKASEMGFTQVQDELKVIAGGRNNNLTLPGSQNCSPEMLKSKDEKPESPEVLPEFGASKSDPKYQTLPYNTKFSMSYIPPGLKTFINGPGRRPAEGNENTIDNIEVAKNNNNNNLTLVNNNMNQQLMNVVHSIPISAAANKGLATPAGTNQIKHQPPTNLSLAYTSSLTPRVYGGAPLLSRGQPVGGASTTPSTIATTTASNNINLKPVSSVAPTSVELPLGVYQTSSTKVHPVLAQTFSSTPQGLLREAKGDLSPGSQSSSSSSSSAGGDKPALPPKPALPVKPTPPPPPRQTHTHPETHPLRVDTSSEAIDSAISVLRGAANLPNRVGSEPPVPKPASATLVVTSSESSPPPPPPPTTEPPDDGPLSEDSSNQRRPSEQVIKARPLTIKKQAPSEIPRLRNGGLVGREEESETTLPFGSNRRIEMPPAFLFPETEAPPADLVGGVDAVDHCVPAETRLQDEQDSDRSSSTASKEQTGDSVVRRVRKGNLKGVGGGEHKPLCRRVSFDPLALLLDASLEGELELVARTAAQVRDPSSANDEGITALHNAICAGHVDIVTFLVRFGCDVNAQDSDGWTPLHCAASCNNLAMVRFLVEHGACILATTLSDHETAAEKCEEDEEGFDGCSEYLYSVQEKLGILNNGVVYAVFNYEAHNSDELSFREGERLVVLRKGDEWEREWWWARLSDREGYIPRNLLGLYPRVNTNKNNAD